MYKVLIVDDETIILSGIKFLIDWEQHDCTIVDTARNGKDALEKIRICQPDIVLCDIRMPVMDGIELLQTVSRDFPSIVFLMLTNLQDFNLARDAFRYQVADYLLKNQLDADILAESLEKAKKELEKRNKIVQADNLNYFDTRKQKELLQNTCLELLFSMDNDSLTLFVWGQGATWKNHICVFSSKFASASENITQVLPAVCATPCYFGVAQLSECRDAYFHRVEYFYLNEDTELEQLPLERPVFEPLGLTGIGSQLTAELNSRSLTGCMLLLDKAIRQLTETVHQKSQAIWLCNELYRSSARLLEEGGFDTSGYSEINALTTRSQVICWIEKLKNILSSLLRQHSAPKNAPVEKARQYVLDHVEERISLQDVADEVNISAGYLSTLFKKQYNQSFIAFINQAKVERACTLIREKRYRINEISYRLGFENAYYFTKVFRRYTGMTPSDWEKQHGDENPDIQRELP